MNEINYNYRQLIQETHKFCDKKSSATINNLLSKISKSQIDENEYQLYKNLFIINFLFKNLGAQKIDNSSKKEFLNQLVINSSNTILLNEKCQHFFKKIHNFSLLRVEDIETIEMEIVKKISRKLETAEYSKFYTILEQSFEKIFLAINDSENPAEMRECIIEALAFITTRKKIKNVIPAFEALLLNAKNKEDIDIRINYLKYISKYINKTIWEENCFKDYYSLLPKISSPPLEKGENYWKNYTIRKAEWDNISFYNTSKAEKDPQKNYGLRMHRATMMCKEFLAIENFEKFIEFCAFQRNLIAKECKHQPCKEFGQPRHDERCGTSCKNMYENLGKLLYEKLQNRPLDPNLIEQKITENYSSFQLMYKNIPLSTFCLWTYNSSFFIDIGHTEPKHLPEIFLEIKELYKQALHCNDEEEIMKISGRIFWLFCAAKPWLKGDPSGAELFIRSIWTSKCLKNPPWKENIIPWVEATKQIDMEKFAENFADLFDYCC